MIFNFMSRECSRLFRAIDTTGANKDGGDDCPTLKHLLLIQFVAGSVVEVIIVGFHLCDGWMDRGALKHQRIRNSIKLNTSR